MTNENGKWKMENGKWKMENGKSIFICDPLSSILNPQFSMRYDKG
jgi:hypothetical protein